MRTLLFFEAALAAIPIFVSIDGARAQGAPAAQPEEVIVTASLLGTGVRADLLGASATVLTPENLEDRQTQSVSDALRDVPGVAVNRGGGPGQFTQVRLRGAESNHTLVLIDGIKASDPFYGEFDFATLIADDVARVEVLRGEASSLYGSDAIGGVIQYITATGAEAPGVRGRIETGGFGTTQASARIAGVSDALDYAVSGSYYTTGGFVASRVGSNKLGANIGSLAGKFGYAVSDIFHLSAVLRYSGTKAETDTQDFDFPAGPTYGYLVDSGDYYKNDAFYGLVSGDLALLDGRWTHAVSLQGVVAERDGFLDRVRTSGDKGRRLKASYVTALKFGDADFAQTVTGAIDAEREYFQNTDPSGFADTAKRHSDNLGLVGQYSAVIDDRLALGASARFDKNYRFADATTYHVEASYRFDNGFRPHAAAGSGVKNPLVYELYAFAAGPGGYIGNPDLKPERSDGWEVGFDQALLGKAVSVGVTYFHSTLKDEIFVDYVGPTFAASPENEATDSTREGVETFVTARLDDAWHIDAAYTYLHAVEAGQQELRRAPNIASVNVAWHEPDGRWGANLTVRYNGDQKDSNFTLSGPPRVTLPAFTLVDFGGDWKLNEVFQLYGRVENLFDDRYEEAYTYRSAGRAFYAGIRAGF